MQGLLVPLKALYALPEFQRTFLNMTFLLLLLCAVSYCRHLQPPAVALTARPLCGMSS